MSDEQKKDLIRVAQLPVIEEHLKALSDEIDAKVSEAMSMVCTEDTVKSVKKVRAELNSQFWELEGFDHYFFRSVLTGYRDVLDNTAGHVAFGIEIHFPAFLSILTKNLEV